MSMLVNPFVFATASGPGGSGFGARVSRSTSQTIATGGTEVAIQWTTEDRDDGGTPGYFDAGDPTKFKVAEDGFYLVAANVKLSNATSAAWSVSLRVNGSATQDPIQSVQGDSETDWTSLAAVLYLQDGDYVESVVDHDETNDEEVEAGNFSIAWIGTAGAQVRRAANQSINNATATALIFDTEDHDSGAHWDGANPTRMVFDATGWFVFGASCKLQTTGYTLSTFTAKINGTTDIGFSRRQATWGFQHILIARYMTAGDYAEFYVTHTVGSAQNFQGRAWLAFKASGQGAHATRLSSQTMGPSTDTAWILTAEQRDDGGFIDVGGANPSRMVIPGTGWYLAGGTAEGPATTGFYKDYIRLNGSGADGIANAGEGQNDTTRSGLNLNSVYYFSGSDYCEMMFGNSAGFNRTPQNAYVWVLELGGSV